ncbi:MAG: serine/threonine protein kinase, partial [Cyanobacteria bacterium J06635_10]
QQAAYFLIPETQKQSTHWKIGQLLLQKLSDEEQSLRIFDLVNQLNLGKATIITHEEKQQLARLNLQAGQKAKASTAHQAAWEYFTIGIDLLTENAWDKQYELMYNLYRYGSEAAYLCGKFDEAEALYTQALSHAQTSLDKAVIYRVQMTQYKQMGKNTQAIEIQRQSLQLLGWEMPTEEEFIQANLSQEVAKVNNFLQQQKIESILDLDILDSVTIAEMLRILQMLFYTAWLSGKPTLAFLAIAKMTSLSLQYGNSYMSPFGYAGYGMISIAMFKDYQAAHRFGEVAVKLCEQFDNTDIRGTTNFLFAADVHSWSRPIREADTYYENAYKYGMEAGNWLTASFMMMVSGSDRLTYGKNLDELYEIAKTHADFLYRIKSFDNLDNFNASIIQPIRNLLGLTKTPLTFDDDTFSEAEYLQKYGNSPFHLAWFYAVKIRHAYLFDNQAAYAELIPQLSIVENTVVTHAKTPSCVFYIALMHLALVENTAEELERQLHWNALLSLEEKLTNWSVACPENILHKCLLIQAEKARLHSKKAEAADLYEQAIATAQVNQYGYEEGLANELAAKFYLDWYKEKFAAVHIQEAYYCYSRWGAKAKINDLEKRYPKLLAPILRNQPCVFQVSETHNSCINKSEFLNQTIQKTRSTSTSMDEALDFVSILKASQALSSEIQFSQLISKLMQVVIENAGAEKAALILLENDTLTIKAITIVNGGMKLLNQPIEDSQEVPITVINYVKRSLKKVVLDNATEHPDFIAEEYLMQQKPKSLLCLPILN